MRYLLRSLLPAALMWTMAAVSGHAQEAAPARTLEAVLTFEAAHSGTFPTGWAGGPPETVAIDGTIVHGGRWSARIERTAGSAEGFSAVTKMIPLDFGGKTIEWRGFLKSENVSDWMGLWMRQDGSAPGLAFISMQPQAVKGTNDWKEYSVTLPVHPDGRQIAIGVLLSGTGKVWVDDLRLLVDGKPVWEAPKVERPKTPLELDTAFDAGSGITISKLTPVQIDNLALLGKVWGFLKYHHPAVTSGTRHWDYDLFRVLPAILAASDRDAASAAMRAWIDRLGPLPSCDPCLTLSEENLHLRPGLAWIESDAVAGRELSEKLRAIYRSRAAGTQFFVSLMPNVGNPRFNNEPGYDKVTLPDAGYQLLALYRYWNVIEYWFPYRDLLDHDWDRVLAEFVPRAALASDKTAYELEMIQLLAKVTDTHADIRSTPPKLRPPAGECQLPIIVRFVENQAVVSGYSHASGPATTLKIGDVIETLDGVAVKELIARLEPFYPASNRPVQLHKIALGMTRGACAPAAVGARRVDGPVTISAQRQPLASLNQRAGATHDRAGDTFQLLSADVAYLKLSSVSDKQAASYVERAKGTKGLVIDIRGYPSSFVVFALGSLLVDKPTPFARFTIGDLAHPGAFRWGAPISLDPQQPHYAGKVVILVDETSLSQSEYTTMAFRSSPRAIVVGSTTAGADGNVSSVPLPGALNATLTGIGAFYPDKKPTQRVGIAADVVARPTIAGIRTGRDEVLEEAIRQILGAEAPADAIEKMARPQP